MGTLTAVGLHLALFVFTFRLSPVYPDSGQRWISGLACFSFMFVASLLPLFLWFGMAQKSLPTKTWPVGVLSGLGSGLAIEGALKTHCAISSQNHVLFSHTLDILVAVVIGFLLGLLWEKRRLTQP